jgi:hypothetical protein
MWTDEGVEVNFQSFFKLGIIYRWVDSFMNHPPPPTCHGKEPLISTGWAPNLFYTLRKLEKTLPVSGIEIRIPRSSSACASHYSVSHNGSQTMQTRKQNEILHGADVKNIECCRKQGYYRWTIQTVRTGEAPYKTKTETRTLRARISNYLHRMFHFGNDVRCSYKFWLLFQNAL